MRLSIVDLARLTSDCSLLVHTSQQYERVFQTDFEQMGEEGPCEPGMFGATHGTGGHVPPDRLRRLFLRLLNNGPLKQFTAQEAVEELRAIRDA